MLPDAIGARKKELPMTRGDTAAPAPRVGLFVTCLVNAMRPRTGFAALKLLEDAGFQVDVPAGQTCCGQPNYNSGDREGARALAARMVAMFADHDYVVAPSGSCAAMIRVHFPRLFDADDPLRPDIDALAAKTHELVSFLTGIAGMEGVAARFEGEVTYHDACSGLRELGIKSQPRRLLESIPGLALKEMQDAEVCCGFGGLFCVKYPDISGEMVRKKTDEIVATGAAVLAAGDIGCLLNMEGALSRRGAKTRVCHVAEILAGMADEPPATGGGEDHVGAGEGVSAGEGGNE